MNEEMRQDLRDQIEQMPHWFQDFDHEYISPRTGLMRFRNPDPLETPDDYWEE
jgi:hypothetical protein